MVLRSLCGYVMLNLAGLVALGGEESSLVRNPGFESPGQKGLPAEWAGLPDVYQRDETVSRSGKASLKFTNNDPKTYVICSQPLSLQAGRMYELSAWVRTRGIRGSESGATLCVEWYGQDGKYLGGAYPAGVKGDTDWTCVKGVTSRIPAEAKGISLGCYVRQGMTGTAWWDDVCVRRAHEDPLSTVLLSPPYRGKITDAGPEQIRVRAELNLIDYDLALKDVALGWSIVSEAERAECGRGTLSETPTARTDVVIPAKGLAEGAYRVEVILTRRTTGQVLGSRSHRIVRVPASAGRTAACIDGHNRLIHEGRPFFPLGMYWGSINKDELAIYADGPFNCLMPYGQPSPQQMDLAQEKGLKVIYTVKDIYYGTDGCPKDIRTDADEQAHIKAKVEAFGRHPALLAWYLNDELGVEMMPRLVGHRRWMEALDPHHPTWVVLYQVDNVRQYIDSFDVIGTDPYPIPDRPAAMAGEWTRKTVAAVCGARPVWQVPQVFNWACYRATEAEKKRCRPPTFEEMRSMAWQCIAEGANGLIFYSWFDLRRDTARPFAESWPLVKRMGQEIKDLIPVLLSVESAPSITVEPASGLCHRVWQSGDTTTVVVVNSGTEARTTRLGFPSRPASIVERGSGERPAVDERPGVRVDLKPLEVKIYQAAGLGRKAGG
jgi:hypothetical protein